jgi:hypothetical protein
MRRVPLGTVLGTSTTHDLESFLSRSATKSKRSVCQSERPPIDVELDEDYTSEDPSRGLRDDQEPVPTLDSVDGPAEIGYEHEREEWEGETLTASPTVVRPDLRCQAKPDAAECGECCDDAKNAHTCSSCVRSDVSPMG